MFTTALRLLSMARIGNRAKRAAAHGLRTAALYALAGALVLAGVGFALAAAYFALLKVFGPVEAAGIMAAALAIPGLAIFAVHAFVSRRARQGEGGQRHMPESVAETINTGAQDATRTLGPLNMIALALIAGIAAGRSLKS